jgi:hypothetical protein
MLKKALAIFLIALSCFIIIELSNMIYAGSKGIQWAGIASQYGITWKGITIDEQGRLQTEENKVSRSTGTVVSCTAGSISTYTVQNADGVSELFVCTPDNNSVDIRYMFYSDGLPISGRGLELSSDGQTLILNTWSGSIYFEPESGTADVSIQEVYE